MRQCKAGIRQVIPLRGDPEARPEDDEIRERGRLLYLSLEDELMRQGRGKGHIVLNEVSGKRYTSDEMARVFRKARVAAGLPDGMSFIGFRDAGAPGARRRKHQGYPTDFRP